MNGKTIFQSKGPQLDSIYINSVNTVKLGNEVYLLRVTKPLPVNNASAITPIKYLFRAEILIILIIMLMVMVLLYLKYIKPIEKLQKDMEDYKNGIKPNRTGRSDELGRLRNSFVGITDEIDFVKKRRVL